MSQHLFMSSVVSIPNVDVLVPAPKVSAGLLPNRPVPVPKDGALVVVVPKPAVLFPNKFCNHNTCTDCYKMTPIQPVMTTTIYVIRVPLKILKITTSFKSLNPGLGVMQPALDKPAIENFFLI